MRNLLDEKLHIGDSREKIETTLSEIGINASYDRYLNRYQSTKRDKKNCPYQAISIYIKMDKSHQRKKIDVFMSYTMP